MNNRSDRSPSSSSGSGPKDRIETQIHRRRKAKALTPLEPEWDISQPDPPSQLRMSPSPVPPPDLLKHSKTALDRSDPEKGMSKPRR